ncbi:polyprenyl synthetase family protein [Mesorhizobium sp. BAC0120]|uniref:polyprenyl synthetase family protein n=1 Tax=Mesorhizobium sp. BAC0120 TaxID=3090670 RepID=UPI00298BE732|nr:polyprenyl synthetase family protein [Mesorhizobium sp. BAC0120]MDW6025075.1 polyprenyl synthetase family protein [Mesorhizobium sp. BAC0120]
MALDPFHARLASYRETALARLLAAVPRREPQRYLYDPLTSYLTRTGKGIRPALCMATCQAFGGDASDALASAAAIEMLHTAFLVHDDIEDESELRRGLPTLHSEQGVPIALNAGDMMTAISVRILRENLPALGHTLTAGVYDEFEHMMQESLEGQAMELGWMRDNRLDISDEDYLRMVLKKTCWYSFIHPCRIGALIGTRNGVDLDRFNRFGSYLGTAFQIQDDLLNLTGDERRYGKEIGGDLLEGKRTLMLIHLLRQVDTREAARINAYLGEPRPARSAQDMRWILELMRSRGSLDHARKVTRQLAGAALYEFNRAFRDVPESDEKTFLNQVISYMVSRDV